MDFVSFCVLTVVPMETRLAGNPSRMLPTDENPGSLKTAKNDDCSFDSL